MGENRQVANPHPAPHCPRHRAGVFGRTVRKDKGKNMKSKVFLAMEAIALKSDYSFRELMGMDVRVLRCIVEALMALSRSSRGWI